MKIHVIRNSIFATARQHIRPGNEIPLFVLLYSTTPLPSPNVPLHDSSSPRAAKMRMVTGQNRTHPSSKPAPRPKKLVIENLPRNASARLDSSYRLQPNPAPRLRHGAPLRALSPFSPSSSSAPSRSSSGGYAVCGVPNQEARAGCAQCQSTGIILVLQQGVPDGGLRLEDAR